MIESKQNQQIRNIIKLSRQAKERKKKKVFLVEGVRMFREAPKEQIVKVYATQNFYQNNKPLFDGIAFELVSDKVFKEISDTVTPQGVLAVIRQKQWKLEELVNHGECPFLLILENLQDPGNLGTILRTGEGAGITGVIMSKDTVDIYNPKVIRSTMGSVYRVPFTYVEDLKDVMKLLKEHHITSYAAHLKGENVYERDFRSACAFLIGNEGNGLTDEISTMAEQYIKIPMCGKLESLNAAIAAAVLMYETRRQRL